MFVAGSRKHLPARFSFRNGESTRYIKPTPIILRELQKQRAYL